MCVHKVASCRPTFTVVGLLFIFLVIASQGIAQTVGLRPFGSYVNNFDKINLADLGIHIDIPLYVHAARGPVNGVSVHLVYDSGYYDDNNAPWSRFILGNYGQGPIQGGYAYASNIGWRLVTQGKSGGSISEDVSELLCENGTNSSNQVTEVSFEDTTGYIHYLGPAYQYPLACQQAPGQGSAPYPPSNPLQKAWDGSGYTMVTDPSGKQITVTSPSGVTYTRNVLSSPPAEGGATTVVDTNGNTGPALGTWIQDEDPANVYTGGTEILTDSSGVSVTIANNGYPPAANGPGQNYGPEPDATGWFRGPTLIQYKDTANNLQTIKISYTTGGVEVPSIAPAYMIVAQVDTILFPDGSSYHFTYQQPNNGFASFGMLGSVTLPTGGVITYTTQATANGCGVEIFSEPLSLARTTSDGTTTYQLSNPCSGQFTDTVTKADGSSEVYQFESATYGLGSLPIEKQHVWMSASGSVLKTVQTCYNGASGNCLSVPTVFPPQPTQGPLPIAITQKTTTTSGADLSKRTEYFDPVTGSPTETDEYDADASTLLRKTIISYATLGNNITNHPSSVTITDGLGNTVSQTTYGYDESGLAPTLGLPEHTSGLTGARGNLTSVHKWLNTASATVDTHLQYDDAGQVTASQDANGNWTQFAYDPPTDSCLNTVTLPTASGVITTTSQTCDPNTGLPASSTDANGKQTTYGYDSMLHQNSIQYPDGGSTSTNYNSGSSIITTIVAASPNPSQVTTVSLDGYGRTAEVQLPGGAKVDTQYDNMGRVHSLSNPYYTTSDSTYGLTTYTYDTLGRKISTTEADGSSLTWSFTNNIAVSQNEAGHLWQYTSDGLGRLTQVLEYGSALLPRLTGLMIGFPGPGSPVGGPYPPFPPAHFPAALETDYIYDALDNLLRVNQLGTAGDTARMRTFTYDSLSRLLTSSNPETGMVCYGQWAGLIGGSNPGGSGPAPQTCLGGYDPNGNLLFKTDARGVVTSYTYDALNRLKKATYSDGSPNEAFGYDGLDDNGSPLVPGVTNAIGRLDHLSNDINVASNFSFDAMGRMKDRWECLATDCSYSVHTSAAYDFAGNMTSLTYPDGRQITQAFDAAGHLSVVAANNTTYIGGGANGGIAYTPAGAEQAFTLGNGVSQVNQYNTRLQPCHASASSPLFPPNLGVGNLFDRQSFYNPSASSPCGNEASNNGNIFAIVDNLNVGRTQSFGYDSLNRLTYAGRSDGGYNHTYQYDSFGNMMVHDNINASMNYSIDPATNQLLRNAIAGVTDSYGHPLNDFQYDASGNMVNSGSLGNTLAYNADNQIVNVGSGGTSVASYIYAADGNRAFKSTSAGTTDYVYFNGQPIAEKDQTGAWTDYIYANGRKIARVGGTDTRIHTSGVFTANWNELRWNLPPVLEPDGTPYTVQAGDMLCFRQFNGPGAVGGPMMTYSNGRWTPWLWGDTQGVMLNQMFTQNQWVNRCTDLTLGGATTGTQAAFYLLTDVYTAAGPWDIWYADMAITRANGSVIAVATTNPPTPIVGAFQGGNWTGTPQAYVETVSAANDPTNANASGALTHYYLADHLGTTQLELAAGGWQTWQGQFTPFGAELPDGQALTHYKFTGKERDTESGLDYFGARYYGSPMGRMMSPDPSGLYFADPKNPQSLNLYSYALNNPLMNIDPTGLTCQKNDNGDDYDDGDGQGCAIVDQEEAAHQKNDPASATAYGGRNAAALEMVDALRSFIGSGSKGTIQYLPQDPFTLNFQKSLGMQAILAKVKGNCSASTGSGGVGTGEAAVNTVIDYATGQGSISELQMGSFTYSYSQQGGILNVTVSNPITTNSLAYHALASNQEDVNGNIISDETVAAGDTMAGSGIDSLGRLTGSVPFGRVDQELQIQAANPCR